MADGLNDARAMRVAEVMMDFRTIQHRLSTMLVTPSPEESQALGYMVLRAAQVEAQATLSGDIGGGSAASGGNGSPEETKLQLQRLLRDAAARRFRVQRAYLKAAAAIRWIGRRQQVLQGGPPSPSRMSALRQADNTLRTEVNAVTDSRVFNELKTKDQRAGHWTAEMPDLNTLLSYIRNH